jgi:hypothetical protein
MSERESANQRRMMAKMLLRLTKAGWVQSSLVSDDRLEIRFTPRGLARAKALTEIAGEIGWPRTINESAALLLVCVHARRKK